MNRMHLFAALGALICGACGGDRDADHEKREPMDLPQQLQIAVVCDSLGSHIDGMGFAPRIAAADDTCTVEGTLPLAAFALEVDPLEVLRDSLTGAGWIEHVESMADGPGTSSFRLEQHDRYCRFQGGAPAWIDDDGEIRQSEEYTLSVACRSRK